VSGFLGLISPLGWQLEEGFMRRYTAARNCTRFLKAVRCLNRGKREPKVRRTFGSGGIKPDFRIKPEQIALKTQSLNLEYKPKFRLMEHPEENLPGLILAEQRFPFVMVRVAEPKVRHGFFLAFCLNGELLEKILALYSDIRYALWWICVCPDQELVF
jgi:hypothetical protein